MDKPRQVSRFTSEIAVALAGVMSDYGVTQAQIAQELGRSTGFVSERLAGKAGRAMTTDMLDAVARLAGIPGAVLVIELGKRMERKRQLDAERTTRARRNADVAKRLRSI